MVGQHPRAGADAGSASGRPSRPRRTRGERAGLDLDQIVDAALTLSSSRSGPDALTMQAIADHLGVDRKAINHHVTDRDTLLSLVALRTFADTFSGVHIAARDDWQDSCRAYAHGFTASVIASGTLADYLPVGEALVTRILQTTEALLAKLVDAGFDDATAVRSVVLLVNLCFGYSRDVLQASRQYEFTRPLWLRKTLAGQQPHEFPHLERIAAGPPDTYDASQLDFSLDVFLRGLAGLVDGGS